MRKADGPDDASALRECHGALSSVFLHCGLKDEFELVVLVALINQHVAGEV